LAVYARPTPIWFRIAAAMSVPAEFTKLSVGLAAPGLPVALDVLNGAQPDPLLAHTTIGLTATNLVVCAWATAEPEVRQVVADKKKSQSFRVM